MSAVHNPWVIAFAGALVLVLTTGFGRMAYAVVLPSMKAGLSLSYTQTGLIATANMVGYTSFALVGGAIAVRYGSRTTIFVALMVMGVAVFLTGFSGSFLAAAAFRFVTGMGNAAAVVPMLALTAAWFPSRRRGLAAGIVTAGVGVGTTIGGLFIPSVVKHFGHDGWRYAWFLLGVTIFIVSFGCYLLIRDHPDRKEPGSVDRAGRGAAWSEVLRQPQVWKFGLMYFMFGFSYIIYATFFVTYLTNEIGLTPKQAGSIFAVLGFVSIGSGILWGWLSDHTGRSIAFALAYGILSASSLLLVWSDTQSGFYASALLFGVTLTAIPSIMTAAIGDTVGPRLAPAALGGVTLLFGVGQATGPAVAGWLKDTSGTFTGAFALSSAMLFLGCVTAIATRQPSATRPSTHLFHGKLRRAA